MDGEGAIALDCVAGPDKARTGSDFRGKQMAGLGRVGWICALAALWALPTQADSWRRLNGAEIGLTLERQVLRYDDGSEQVFTYGGLTEYRIGWPNEGHWKVANDQYCAMWAPSRDWACYDVSLSGEGQRVRFVDESGRAILADIVPQ